MNFIDLSIIILILLIVWEGYARGFIVSLLSLVRFAVGIPVSFFIADKYSLALYNSHFRENISSRIFADIESTGISEYIASVKTGVPEFISGTVDLSFLDNANTAAVADGVMKNIVDPVAETITKVALFVVSIVVFYLITGIILHIVKKMSNSSKAPFKNTNKFLGAVLGLLKALVIVFAVATVGGFITDSFSSGDNIFLKQLESSAVIEFVNKFNPIL